MTLKDFIEKLSEMLLQVDECKPSEDKEGTDIIIGIVDHDNGDTYLIGHGCPRCILDFFSSSPDIVHNSNHRSQVH